MRWLIWYFRSCFCNHEWDIEEIPYKIDDGFGKSDNVRVSCTCKKCGWHRKYWKH